MITYPPELLPTSEDGGDVFVECPRCDGSGSYHECQHEDGCAETYCDGYYCTFECGACEGTGHLALAAPRSAN